MSNKLISFAKAISIEPGYFLYYSVFIIMEATSTNLLLQKKCRINKISEPDLNTSCDDEKLGILFISEMNVSYRFIMVLFCSCCSIFATSWSDSSGRRRRFLIFLPIIGQIFKAMVGCLHSYFWSWNPLFAVLSIVVIEMMTGGMALMVPGTRMYMCDVSSMESRSMRMGILQAVKMLAELVGFGGSGFILRSLGFFYTYLVCFALSIISLILAAILMRNTSVPVREKSGLSSIFSVLKITNGFRIVFNRSLGKKRIVVLMLLIIHLILSISIQGEKDVLYLFLRYKFHWDEREFSSYVFYRYVGVIIGSVFCSVVLSKLLQVHDGLIGVFAGTCDTIAVLGYLFAYKKWHLYVAPLFDVFHGAALSVSFSFLSKFYDSSELGRLSSVVGVSMLIFPTCYPIYNGIFHATLDIFPSAYFILSTFLDTTVVFLYCVVYLLSRRFEEVEMQKAVTEEEENRMINLK